MLETIFYFQILVFLTLLGFGIVQRSASIIVLAGVFSLLTGVMLVSSGIDYPSGWLTQGADENRMTHDIIYTKHATYNDEVVNMWHYILLYGGFVWIVAGFVLAIKGSQGNFIEQVGIGGDEVGRQ